MNEMNAPIQRDPVAVSIEEYLRQEAGVGHGPLKMREHPDGVAISFGGVSARGETGDIALVRLARSLLDDQRFAAELMGRLRGLMPS
jgi:hypothetical protein